MYLRFLQLALLHFALSSVALSQTKTGEWRHYGGDSASTKYSPLAQIDASNFAELETLWEWSSVDGWVSRSESGGEWWGKAKDVFAAIKDDEPELWRGGLAPRTRSLKVTPLKVGDQLFVVTPIYQAAAIDARTGATQWVYNPKSYEAGTPTMSLLWNHRGPAYWEPADDSTALEKLEPRIIWGTGDGWLIAVNAETGRPIQSFGSNGRIDLMEGLLRAERGDRDYLNALRYSLSSPPLVVGNVVVTGSSIADRRITKEAIPGDVRGWDARTGELLWTFHTIPHAGEFGHDTWLEGSAEYTGNVNVWTMMSADVERGIVYLPIGTPTNDFYGGHRPGDNLFAESLVAVEAANGKRLWHFQTVHHGVWDYDLPAAPNLIDLEIDGTIVPAVAQITKQGFTFVFNRVTGEPLWPIEERAVPSSTMPGELLSETQPHPTKPPPFEAQGVTESDLIDFTPEIKAEALEIAKGFQLGPLFTPPSLKANGTKATLQRPGLGGGANWHGAAVDPETGLLYVPSRNSITAVTFYTPDPEEGGSLRYTHRSAGGSAGPRNLPLFKPPYSRMTAIDLTTGEHAWMQPLGTGDHIRNHPDLAHLDLPPLGGDRYTGPLLTKTLLIQGQAQIEAGDGPPGWLVARNKTNGIEVGRFPLPGIPIGSPMTYTNGDRQVIAITVSGNPPRLIAVGLPSEP